MSEPSDITPDSYRPRVFARGDVLIRVGWIFSLLTAVIALWTIVTTLDVVRIAWSPLPYADSWIYWAWYPQFKTNMLKMIASQHNEHRIVIPRLFFLADQYLFGARNIFLLVAILLVQAGHAALLSRLAVKSAALPRECALGITAIILTAFFSAQQFANLTWGFQIQFVGVVFAVTAAFAALMQSETASRLGDGRRSRKWFVVTLLLGAIATYSMANGIFVWAFLLSLAFWWRAARRRVLILGASGGILAVLYFSGYQSPYTLSKVIYNLPKVLAFLTGYLGAPIDDLVVAFGKAFDLSVESWRPFMASLTGTIGLVAGLRFAIRLLESPGSFPPARLVILHVAGFLMLSACSTAIGRSGFLPLSESFNSRYMTPALIFWSCIAVLVWSEMQPSPGGAGVRMPPNGWLLFTGFSLLIVAIHQPTRLVNARGYAQALGQAEMTIIDNVFDTQSLRNIYYDPAAIPASADLLRRERVSSFSYDWPHWIGANVRQHYTVTSGGCRGAFDAVTRLRSNLRPGVAVSGWAWDEISRQAPGRVLLASREGAILGFAYSGTERADVSATSPAVRSDNTGWIGYISWPVNSEIITAYATVAGGRSICPVGSISTAGIPAEKAGHALAGISVSIEGDWSKDGYYPSVGPPPAEGPAFGSYSGSDANVGTLRLSMDLMPGGRPIAIPLVTGPGTKGLSIRVVNRVDGATLGVLMPPPQFAKWELWKVYIPAGPAQLEIICEDQGRGWGQWLAVGTPADLK